MKVEYTHDQVIKVTPTGLFNYSEGYNCIPEIKQLVKKHGNANIVFDFSQTTFMDSSGIGALIALTRNLPEDSPRIKLLQPSIAVQKLLEICHLHRLFDIEVKQSIES